MSMAQCERQGGHHQHNKVRKEQHNMVRDIIIKPVLNGFVCCVGCQQVVFKDTKSLVAGIREYYDAPEKTEKRYLSQAVNKMNPVDLTPMNISNQQQCPVNREGPSR